MSDIEDTKTSPTEIPITTKSVKDRTIIFEKPLNIDMAELLLNILHRILD